MTASKIALLVPAWATWETFRDLEHRGLDACRELVGARAAEEDLDGIDDVVALALLAAVPFVLLIVWGFAAILHKQRPDEVLIAIPSAPGTLRDARLTRLWVDHEPGVQRSPHPNGMFA